MKSRSIRTRLLTRQLALLLSAFLIIALFFNLFLHIYITTSAREQLDNLISVSEEMMQGSGGRRRDERHLPDLSTQPKSRLGADAFSLVIGNDYTLLDYMQGEELVARGITGALEADSAILQTLSAYHVKTEDGSYYLSAIEDYLRNDAFMVFYIDVSAIIQFANTVNLALIIIMLILIPISYLIADRLSKSFVSQVESLSSFAVTIGRGDFSARIKEEGDTEFRSLAKALNETADELKASNEQQTQFFQNVSHELRTPLMSIRCYAEGIECGVMDGKEAAKTILTETDRLSDMVEDLIYISKLDGKPDMTGAEPHDLRETFSAVASDQRHVAESKGISFEFDFDEEPVMMAYKENDIRQLCSNLISNAIRYARSKVILTCRNVKEKIIIQVKDDGEGIREEDLPHLFERFYKGRDGKHGIGLSIVYSVTQLYGGTITASNEDGALFSVCFPHK